MGTITNICAWPIRKFTLKEANDELPLLKRVFERHEVACNKALADQRFYIKAKAPEALVRQCDDRVSKEMAACGKKLLKLGVKPFGSGFVGFDSGCFYWSWRHGESIVEYYHDYEVHPISGRRKITILTPVK